MVDLTPGVEVIMIGLIVCIIALVLVLLVFFIGRRPLIEGGSCFPREDDNLYRCVGATYMSEQEIQRGIDLKRERDLAQSFEIVRTTPLLPDAAVVVPASAKPKASLPREVYYTDAVKPNTAVVVPAPARPQISVSREVYYTEAVEPMPIPPPPPPPQVTVTRDVYYTETAEPTLLPSPPSPPNPQAERVYVGERPIQPAPRVLPVQHTWYTDVDGDVGAAARNDAVTYGWRA